MAVKEQNTVLDPDLLKAMLRFIPAVELAPALKGMECLARYAAILLRQRKRARDR
jgi:hypothetical protein